MAAYVHTVRSVVRAHASACGYFLLGIAVAWGAYGLFLLSGTQLQPLLRGEDPPKVAYEARTATAPVRLSIPALDIDATFEAPLGLSDDGSIEVPEQYDTVAWYEHGPVPGMLGPAVVLGHIDSRSGPAIFYHLGQLEAGDEVIIERADGAQVVFSVTALERVEQEGFPTDAVYGDIDHAGLRLVTCSGTYDREEEQYTHNLIVFAELIEVR